MSMKKMLSFVMVMSMLASLFISIPAVHAAPAPVVYYNFEGDYKNLAGTDYNAKASHSIVKFEDKGAVGKAVNLNGGYLEIENSKNIKFDKEFAMTAWVKFDSVEEFNPCILSQADNDGGYTYSPFYIDLGLGYTTIGSSFVLKMPEEDNFQGFQMDIGNYMESALLKERWTHVAVSFDGKMCSTYIDGQYVSSEELPEDLLNFVSLNSSQKDLTIGKGQDGKFRGYIDEFKLFNKAISADEAAAIATEGRKIPNHKMVFKIENPYFIIDGVQKEIDPGRGTVPVIDSGRTLVPIRSVIEEMGGTIGWDGNDQRGRADINLGDKNIKIWLYNL
jgi:hypothetical protein